MDKSSQTRRKNHHDVTARSFTTIKEDKDEKSEFSHYVNSEKLTNDLTNGVTSSSLIPGRQRRKLFNGGLKLSRNKWVSMGHEKPTRKNRVLKSEKSMDDAQFLKEKQRGSPFHRESSSIAKESVELDQGLNLDTLPEEFSLESFNDTLRRGSICEEMEKEIFDGGISLHKMRKAMVIQQTLKDRFLM
ncbi:uncharacterized protein LOC144658701 [Oculina patagonica]